MGDFNYKKWLTENKYGKPNINYVDINEQQIGGSEIFFGCQKDDNGNYGYTPMIPFNFDEDLINQNDWIERLRYNEYDGGNTDSWPSQLVNNGVLEPAWSGSITNTEEGTITLQSGGTYQICPSGSINTDPESNQDPESEPTGSIGGMPGTGIMGKPVGGGNKFPSKGNKKPMSKPRLKKEATPKLAKNTSRLKQIKEIIKKEVNKLNNKK